MFICDFTIGDRSLQFLIMSTIEPGDLVRCIQVDHSLDYVVELGATYTCQDVISHADLRASLTDPEHEPTCTIHGDDCHAGGIKLREKPLPDKLWWCLACFEPIIRRKIDWNEFVTRQLPADPLNVRGPRLPERV